MIALTIIRIESIEGDKIIVCSLDGHSYLDFPGTLHYLGDLFVKTGWNSDRNEVYYKQ